MRITFNRVVKPRFNMAVDEEVIARVIPEARTCIAELSRLLDGHEAMAGDGLSLADLLLAPHLSMFALAPEGKESNLVSWLDRMEARPSMQATSWDRLLEGAAAA